MIQQLNRYGAMDIPEELKPIEIKGNASDIIRSTYSLWLPIAESILNDNPEPRLGRQGMIIVEGIYNEATQLLKPHAKAFANVKPKEIETVISEVDNNSNELSGFYLSALINETELSTLEGVFQQMILGYRLAPGKKLTVRPDSNVYELGSNAEGDIINHGIVRYFASDASSGVQINFGDIDSIGDVATGGVQINFGTTRSMATYAYNGIQINLGNITEDMAFVVSGGMQLNLGNVKDIFASSGKGGILVNFGKVGRLVPESIRAGFLFNIGTSADGNTPSYGKKVIEKVTPLINTLESRIREIEFFKDLEDSSSKATEQILAYNWKNYEQEILEMGRQIEKVVK